ncbi:MAG: hypothetical protein D6729_19120 [Deltaproteobacteria bacterium]|nr:MAG: hypothetical protein D6729_19120 [Deltaproteobacteria bacterium]
MSERARARAAAILKALGAMGTDALAVGPRDLAGGVHALKVAALEAGVPLLSANLVGPTGAPLFEASRIVERGGLRVGIVGVSTADLRVDEARAYVAAHASATDPAVAVRRAVAALEGKVDLVVLLGRLDVREMRAVVPRTGVPLAFVGSSGQAPEVPARLGPALVFDGGMRGQGVLKVRLSWRRTGLFGAKRVRELVPAPKGAAVPNRVRVEAHLLDTRVPADAAIDAIVDPVRSGEERRARRRQVGQVRSGPTLPSR